MRVTEPEYRTLVSEGEFLKSPVASKFRKPFHYKIHMRTMPTWKLTNVAWHKESHRLLSWTYPVDSWARFQTPCEGRPGRRIFEPCQSQ